MKEELDNFQIKIIFKTILIQQTNKKYDRKSN